MIYFLNNGHVCFIVISFCFCVKDVPSVDVGSMMNQIQNTFFESNPLMIDAGMDNNVSLQHDI